MTGARGRVDSRAGRQVVLTGETVFGYNSRVRVCGKPGNRRQLDGGTIHRKRRSLSGHAGLTV